MPKMNKKHIEALGRSITSKVTALNSRHLPANIMDEITIDIALLQQIKSYIYHCIDNKNLFMQ